MLLVFSYSYSGVMPETDWKIKNLKGKVKSMVKTEYGYENSGKELIVDDMYIYNEKGNLIEIKKAVSTDVKDNRFLENSIKITYNYKVNGDYEKITEIATAKWTYLYDKNGNEQEYISIIKTGSEGKTKISIYLKFKDTTRDEYGNLTRSTSVRYDYSKKKEKAIYKRLENKYEYY